MQLASRSERASIVGHRRPGDQGGSRNTATYYLFVSHNRVRM